MIVLIPTESTLSSWSQIVFFIFPKKRRAINHDVFLPDIFHVPGMLNFSNPAGKPAQDDDPLLVHKFISQPLFGGGQVILRPEAEKGRQFVRNDTMVSFVSFIVSRKRLFATPFRKTDLYKLLIILFLINSTYGKQTTEIRGLAICNRWYESSLKTDSPYFFVVISTRHRS